jgi:hypothetical protein
MDLPLKQKWFICEPCEFKCCRKSSYNDHLKTKKHRKFNDLQKSCMLEYKYNCENCERKYIHRQSLWKHKSVCSDETQCDNNAQLSSTTTSVINYDNVKSGGEIAQHDAILLDILNHNNQLQKMIIEKNEEFKKAIIDITSKINVVNNVYNNMNNHKNFSLNFFLNDTCKNAMNISDFVNSISTTECDLANTGKMGFVYNTSKLIMDKLNELEITERPIHCSDPKRKKLHVKENNTWNTDDETVAPIMSCAVKNVSYKLIKNINDWETNPNNNGFKDSSNPKNEEYLRIVSEVMTTDTREIGKVVDKITKNVVINKNIISCEKMCI